MTRKKFIFYTIGFLFLEALLIAFIDRPISAAVRNLDASHPAITDLFRTYTDFAKAQWYLVPSGLGILICAIWLRMKNLPEIAREKIANAGHDLSFFFLSILASGLVTDIVKRILGRARPVELERDGIYGFAPFNLDATFNSMPSGHTTTAAALTASLIILCPRGKYLWLAIGFAFALSLIMVNAHYVADVVGGCMVGILTTVALARYRRAQGMFPWIYGIFPIDRRG